MVENELLKEVIEYNHKKYISFKNGTNFVVNKDYEKILNARYQKVSRIKKRLLYLLIRYENIWFVTFTFSNKYINKTQRTKRDLIKTVLNSLDIKYILNIDYGKQTERQHFHCICALNENLDLNSYLQKNYLGGYSLSIQCKNGLNDLKRLSKYINKLTNHCIKSTTNRQRIVYNFKGYDNFCPTCHDSTLAYKLELSFLENVTLLDKGDITGNFILEN